jgi:hypothetical protein
MVPTFHQVDVVNYFVIYLKKKTLEGKMVNVFHLD